MLKIVWFQATALATETAKTSDPGMSSWLPWLSQSPKQEHTHTPI